LIYLFIYSRLVRGSFLQSVSFHTADVVGGPKTSHVAITTTAASELRPPSAHATTKTLRHEAVDDRISTALNVRQQVGGQLSTTKRYDDCSH